ncbi:MAG: hypothetical protein KC438_07515 [Thermomicrobiales bacterium]|nr:hypothetical protein [Thermomicrobiales bacterium]
MTLTAPYTIDAFHADALAILEKLGHSSEARAQIRARLEQLAQQPGILPDIALERLHSTGSTATILREGKNGEGALMLLALPAEAPTPIHNHNTWGVACVIEGTNRYWRWERLDDCSDPAREDIRLVEVFDHTTGQSAEWGDPPQDLHAQQGVDGTAYEFVFFGRNPQLQPRAYFDPDTGEVTYAFATDQMK